MVRKNGWIGPLGSAQARVFHPIAKIQEKWRNDHKRLRPKRVVVTVKELFLILRKGQVSYKCRIPEIDDGIKFNICANNFRVDQDPAQPFEDESMATARAHPRAPEPDNNQESRGPNEKTSKNIGQGSNQEYIAKLRRQVVEVENEDCLPENLPSDENENQIPGVHGEWVTPITCPRRRDLNISDAKGGWKNHSWSSIAEMSEFDLFRMCFPEDFIWDVVIPMTNKYIEGPHITLQDFYVWLGCHFLMALFEGIKNKKMWWSEKPIDMFEGAPFRLWKYMFGRRFQNIGAAIQYTNIMKPPPRHVLRQPEGRALEHINRLLRPPHFFVLDPLKSRHK